MLLVLQSEALESLQKSAIRIIYDDGDNDLILTLAKIDSLACANTGM